MILFEGYIPIALNFMGKFLGVFCLVVLLLLFFFFVWLIGFNRASMNNFS